MSIHWTPWRVPAHRRLELFSMGLIFTILIALGSISCLTIFYLLVIKVNLFLTEESIFFFAQLLLLVRISQLYFVFLSFFFYSFVHFQSVFWQYLLESRMRAVLGVCLS